MRLKRRKNHKQGRAWNQRHSTYHQPNQPIYSKSFGLSIKARNIILKKVNFYLMQICLQWEVYPRIFSKFCCRSLTLHQSLMWVTILKPIVHRGVEYGLKVPVRHRFQWRCWSVAESNLEKMMQSSTQKYRTPSKLQNEIENCCFKV